MPFIKGHKHTQEAKEKIRLASMGRIFSEETRRKLGLAVSIGKKGSKYSDEHKKNMSLAHMGKNTWSKGRKLTEEHKRKMSLGMKGVKKPPRSEEYKRNASLANLGKHYSPATEFTSERISGKNNPNWVNGNYANIVKSKKEYRLWRKAVVERDGYACIWCNSKIRIEADHIKSFALYPELRFAIDNGRTLCRECHKTTDTYGGNTRRPKIKEDLR